MSYIYIKYDVPKHYITLEEELTEELFTNLGSTYEDYLDNKWVKLSEEQMAFKDANPNASIKEIWNMELQPIPIQTLAEYKNNKIIEITKYDQSTEVNSFTINSALTAWFTAAERSNYKSSIEAAKLLGQNTLAFFVGDMLLQVPTTEAEYMLAQIQLYADRCFLVTKNHKVNVMNLETIEEVESYDYTRDYPEKLNFDLG
jgi:hypothetical protein